MGAQPLSFAVKAVNEAQATLKDVQGQIQGVTDKAEKSNKSLGGMGSALGDVAKIAGGFVLGAGILKAPGFLMDAAQAAAEDAASMAKLKQAVDNTSTSYDSMAASLGDTISLAQKMAFTDDQARDALALLTAQTGSATEAQKRFGLAMDLARGANIDVVTASKLLGKVTEDNVTVLGKYGIKVKEGASETELFGLIQEKFGGQAKTFADSTAGQFEQVKIQMGELKERIGYALMPIMAKLGTLLVEDVIPALTKAGDWIELHILPALDEFAKTKAVPFLKEELLPALKDLAAFLEESVLPVLKDLFDAFLAGLDSLKQPLKDVLKAGMDLFNYIIDNKPALVIAIAAIGVAIVLALGPASAAFLAITGIVGLLGLFKTSVADARKEAEHSPDISGWQAFLIGLDKEIRGFGKGISSLLAGDWSRAWELFLGFLEAEWRGIKLTFMGGVAWFVLLGDLFAKAISGGFKAAWNAIADFINNTIPNVISIPSVKFAGVTIVPGTDIDLPDNPLPRLARGGEVLKTGLAVVHEGEQFIPRGGASGAGGRFGGNTIIVQGPLFQINAWDTQDVKRNIPMLARLLQQHLRPAGAIGLLGVR